MANKKKFAVSAVAIAAAASMLLGGTFAWQSISQTALNEKEAVINPGGRLHDDFDGKNKDVYVENFADDDIYARVRLDEYFEIIMNKGVTDAEKTEVITTGATKDDTSTYITHKFDAENTTDGWWNWTTGGKTVYMPTFNKNKDSLVADINGTLGYKDAEGKAKPYGDYVAYEASDTLEATEIYDGDSNNADEVGTDFENLAKHESDGYIKTVEGVTHTAKETGEAKFISMADWLALGEGEETGNYWVYDTDGWVYYSSPIKAGEASGLLLDGISLKEVMDDSYYYAINVVGQFITADDLGKGDNTGFYADGETVSDNALTLLKKIGVEVGDTTAGDDTDSNPPGGDLNPDVTEFTVPEGNNIYKMYTAREDGYYDLTIFSSEENLSAEDAATAAASIHLGEVATYIDFTNNENTDDYAAATDDTYLSKAVSVRFANQVKPTNMLKYFYKIGAEAEATVTIDLKNLDTSNVTNMSKVFYDTNVSELDLSGFDTSNVTTMSYMFYDCDHLTNLDLKKFDTSKVTDMSYMFNGCNCLTDLDLKKFDTSKVTDMSFMFATCGALKSIDLSTWDTAQVTSMAGMFLNCAGLTKLDLSTFDTQNVITMENTFASCSELSELILGEKWITSKVTNMNFTFMSCGKLTYDCSGWDITSVSTHTFFYANASGVIPPGNWKVWYD